jgi:hypothetical protein
MQLAVLTTAAQLLSLPLSIGMRHFTEQAKHGRGDVFGCVPRTGTLRDGRNAGERRKLRRQCPNQLRSHSHDQALRLARERRA